jgi:hypothetical protein
MSLFTDQARAFESADLVAFSSVQFISVVIVGSSVLAIINKAMTGTD